MKINWQVEDGYVGHGNHSFEIDDEDLGGYEGEELEKLIDEYVKAEFENHVSYVWQKEE